MKFNTHRAKYLIYYNKYNGEKILFVVTVMES